MNIPKITQFPLFDAETVTRDQLIGHIRQWHHSDYAGKYVVGLMMQIAHFRGFMPITLGELEPNRTHFEAVKAFTTKQQADDWARQEGLDYKYIGALQCSGGIRHFGKYWIGKEPSNEMVNKRLKEYGASR